MLPLVLGIMVDLCDNPKVKEREEICVKHVFVSCHHCPLLIAPLQLQSLSHVTAWQGADSNNCWSLLAKLWSQEEKRLEVVRDMGTLAGKGTGGQHRNAWYLVIFFYHVLLTKHIEDSRSTETRQGRVSCQYPSFPLSV